MPFSPVLTASRATPQRASHSPARASRTSSTSRTSYGSQDELVSDIDNSTTLSTMNRHDKDEALADFTKYFKEKHKNSDNSALKLADKYKIEEEFNSFYKVTDRLQQSDPEEYKITMDEYRRILIKANSGCMGQGCVVQGGKSRKSRKSKKSRKRRKHRKHKKSRKY